MTTSKISAIQASTLRAIRTMDATFASEIRRAIFASIKQQHYIPADDRIKVEVDDVGNPNYLVIIRKKTGNPYINGVEVTAPAAPETAWFQLNIDYAVNSVIDYGGFENDGVGDPAPGVQAVGIDGNVIKVCDGEIYVQLSESDFE